MVPVNATLTEVASPQSLDAHGEPEAVTVTWTGSVPGYLHSPRMTGEADGREVDSRPVRFTIHGPAAVSIVDALTSGADALAVEVTIVDDQAVETIYTLKGLTRYEVGSVADSVRLELRKGRVQ